ncbi:cytochrome b5-like heme/steroid binding domain-containing protein [Fimicolochytrium jonesii]|uniref:cytochrome b5-like heme/steroid binding domain-containing protein n=1 Tax=Fimicolochytrium jonesii TaxID=1396493 RepID=UPI0022FECEA0|nr:cytochrome b5-like heme/steroid binding domain-containing protein [Fimicolochytrium jonesii]KAI8825202.1 cytochrome b5-like heme/steroid binding domain-containing protein [Fimicolochytrium jonesii]
MTFTPPGQNSTRGNLGPEGTESFTPAQLAQFDGKDESKPVYIAIRGVVFDCTTGRSMYGPGGSYGIFAGKDASRALAKSSLKAEDVVADIQGLTEKEVETLEQWETFYRKKYPVVGRLVQ